MKMSLIYGMELVNQLRTYVNTDLTEVTVEPVVIIIIKLANNNKVIYLPIIHV